MMNQEMIRSGQRRRRELFIFEASLENGHRKPGALDHTTANSQEIIVTNFVKDVKGELKEVTRTIGRERI